MVRMAVPLRNSPQGAEAVQDPGPARGVLELVILVLVVVLWLHTGVLFPDISGLRDPKPFP